MSFLRIFSRADKLPGRVAEEGANDAFFGISPGVFNQLDRLQIRGSKELRGNRSSSRGSKRRKLSYEFRDHRIYIPGDDIRYVDWQVSARQENLYVRQGELPKDVIIYLLVDCSRSMLWGDSPKADMQKRLAAALSYLVLTHGDRLYVHPYGGSGNHDLGLVSGKGQFPQLLNYLRELNYGGQASLNNGVSELVKRISSGGILFILSDLLERGGISKVLKRLPPPLWWVNVLHLLHPREIAPSFQGQFQFVDYETGAVANLDLSGNDLKKYRDRVQRWKKRLEMACIKNHAFYTMVDTEASLHRDVIPLLRSQQFLVAK